MMGYKSLSSKASEFKCDSDPALSLRIVTQNCHGTRGRSLGPREEFECRSVGFGEFMVSAVIRSP